jgi:hypothetical protein
VKVAKNSQYTDLRFMILYGVRVGQDASSARIRRGWVSYMKVYYIFDGCLSTSSHSQYTDLRFMLLYGVRVGQDASLARIRSVFVTQVGLVN